MPRDSKVYLQDILDAIKRIESYTEDCLDKTLSEI